MQGQPEQDGVVIGGRRCAIVGDQPLVTQCLEAAVDHGLEVVLVATSNAAVRADAVERGITVVEPGPGLAEALRQHPAEILLSVANLRLIADDVLAAVDVAINFHDGPLPGYAGLNVTTWALLADEHEHAITWHLMTADVDAGAVVATERFAIGRDETAFSLNARCYEAALASFPAIAAALSTGRLAVSPQPDGAHRLFRRHDRPAIVLDPADPAASSSRSVRALDLGHRLGNTVGVVRLVLGDEVLVVDAAHAVETDGDAPPGTVVSLDHAGVRIATADGDLVITAASTPEGVTVVPADEFARHDLTVGAVVPRPDPGLVAAVAELEPVLARSEAAWIDRLAAGPVSSPTPIGARTHRRASATLDLPDGATEAIVVAAIAVWLARTTTSSGASFGVTDDAVRATMSRLRPLTRPPVVRVDIDPAEPFAAVVDRTAEELARLATGRPLLRDAVGRDPRARGMAPDVPVTVHLGPGDHVDEGRSEGSWSFTIRGAELVVDSPADDADPGGLDRAVEQLGALLGVDRDDGAVQDLPLLGVTDVALLDAVNRTDLDHDRSATIDGLFHRQAARTPDAPAASCRARTVSYAELEAAVATMAGRLARLGVRPGDTVGVALPRDLEMVVTVLATLDLGAAYLPLDPTYPMERLQLMVDDAGIGVIVAARATADALDRPGLAVLDPTSAEDAGDVADVDGTEPTRGAHDASDLAYLIYTSGSTGRPKGVMLEHRQVVNFFDAMDRVIDPSGVWLAVTSLSFDISVLELLWTLTRGFQVVLKADGPAAAAQSARRVAPSRAVSFSLFYFAAGQAAAADGYRLLLESARFADRHGFEAVWTPERHFHAFGGSYPNPSVTGAALAAVTEHVGIRAGSVVLPLHSPVRVAEEWAVVDNLSGGRAAISFAAGWQPNDFVLNPGAYATAKQDLARNIEIVQQLWRGESVQLAGHDGELVDVSTLPRPIQAELPVWLTSAGSPATFERAGTLGVNVLTHLLGQSVEQLAENIERYRAARRAAGHAGEGRVTLMLHTFLHRDAGVAREVAREPMKAYLGTAVGLLRDVASAFPTFAGRGSGTDDLFASLTSEEMDQLLEVAADRYLGTSGLFGTPGDALDVVDAVAMAGVDEVACLVDFGVPTDDVLTSLELLLEVKQASDARPAGLDRVDDPGEGWDDSVAALVAHHGVTHLQCTPSLAAMLLADPADRAALAHVRHLMVGGEALPTALAAELRAVLPDRFTNMYGPTETTIWSLTHEITDEPTGLVPIGRPIANTTLFVLDPAGRRLPVGTFGELHIGGEGVARGYHERPDLTAERFVDRPGMGRVYATGDIVRILPDGVVEYAGRADNQVKIRGHRIELAEIEAVIDRHPAVAQSVVVARQDADDTRLVAYVVLRAGASSTGDALRAHVGEVLPDAMVPSAVVELDVVPLTPNGKVDRKALPTDVGSMDARTTVVTAPPVDDLERTVADIWTSALERPVGRDDNFFDIGGHSLLAVKVFRTLTDATAAPLALTDVFRFPTVRLFAAHLTTLRVGEGDGAPADAAASTGSDRGARRRRALARRGGGDGGS